MVRIRKKTSKRLGLREKYSCLKKVTDHHRKMRKTARKLTKAGIKPNPGKNKMVIPNSFPDKEQLLNEMEIKDKEEREERFRAPKNLIEADKVFDSAMN
jgi:nuclear GTP-binding protein